MRYKDIELIIAALEVVNQVDALGFTEEERNRAVDLIETLEEQPDELSFDE